MARKISEDQTRKEMIDPQLERTGWYLHHKTRITLGLNVAGIILLLKFSDITHD